MIILKIFQLSLKFKLHVPALTQLSGLLQECTNLPLSNLSKLLQM